MSSPKPLEILCLVCGADTIIVRQPIYDGFKRIGDTFKCAACGHEYASEEQVPFKLKKRPGVFDESDESRKVSVFHESEKGATCRFCRHYVVNPFTQRCGLSFSPVEATDSCERFAVPDDSEKKQADSKTGSSEKQNQLTW